MLIIGISALSQWFSTMNLLIVIDGNIEYENVIASTTVDRCLILALLVSLWFNFDPF